MSESLEPGLSEISETISNGILPEQTGPSAKPVSHWFRRFLACNPFYILSAGLLLYGLHRVSIDPHFLSKEIAHLIFNFSSLQFYELLLVSTAIFLASRRLWYDSMLLVGLENMLIFVPFILVSQAALIDRRLVWAMCILGGTLAILRISSLKRFIRQLNLPPRVVVIGLVILAVNVALPIVYRILHESKFGTKPDWGAAYHTNKYVWLIALPIICGLANFVPFSRNREGVLPSRGWVSIVCFALWIVATGVHVYSLGYIYDFDLRADLLAPAIWVLCWTAYRRLLRFMPQTPVHLAQAAMSLPVLATALAVSQLGHGVFLVLTILNATIYQRIYARNGGPRLALHLLLISLAAFVAALPQQWNHSLVTELSRAGLMVASIAGYLLVCAALSRDPRLGVLGGLLAAAAAGVLFHKSPHFLQWAIESGIVFALLHSLRWSDLDHKGAGGMRVILCIAWVTHAFAWMHYGGSVWMTLVMVTPVAGGYVAFRFVNRFWGPRIVPLAAVLVAFSGVADWSLRRIESAPVGVLALVGSFALFAAGTVAALTRHRWNPKTKS